MSKKHVGWRFKETFVVSDSFVYQEDHPIQENNYTLDEVEDLEKIYVDAKEKTEADNQ